MKLTKLGLVTLFSAVTGSHVLAQEQATNTTNISVDISTVKGPMKPIWAWFGYDEPNYTYMKDGKKLLSEISEFSKPVPVYVRAHSLLCTGDGVAALKWGSTNAYTEDANGNPVYDWHIVDSIFDTYVKRGMKPLAQIGFMPEALSTNNSKPYHHTWQPGKPYSDIITGWAYPPKDYNKWRDLIYNWVKHCVDRYGKKEVESWWWEVWNEANGYYWKGTQQEFFKLYDYAADGLKKALPTARIGGMNVAGTSSKGAMEWTHNFIKHCLNDTNYATGKIGAPLEAILFHAKGNPKLVNGKVWMNMSPQLRDIAAGMTIARSYPQTKDLPLIIGESDPEGCAACGMTTNPENAYRNGTLYSSYTAASFARKYQLMDSLQANLIGAVSWSFEFEDQPWFYGFRDLATNGVDKPVLNVFRMFSMMKGQRVAVSSSKMVPLQDIMKQSVRGQQGDVGALATKDKNAAAVMVWNYHDQDSLTAPEKIQLQLNKLPGKKAIVRIYVIDQSHSNSYTAWKNMGSPQQPTAAQIAQLEKAGQLDTPTMLTVAITNGTITLPLQIERQGVVLVKADW